MHDEEQTFAIFGKVDHRSDGDLSTDVAFLRLERGRDDSDLFRIEISLDKGLIK